MDSFCTSADYFIDKNRHIGQVFPSLQYDGGWQCPYYPEKMILLQNLILEIVVFMQDNQTYDILEGTVTTSPTTQNKYYTITLIDDSSVHNVALRFIQ